MLENNFQSALIREIKEIFKGSLVMKMDAGYIQGIPDLLVLYKDKWAILECKKHSKATRQANQEYYVNLLNGMSFSSFIFPENKNEILKKLDAFFNRE